MVMRRIQRRMGLNHINQLNDYNELLRNNLDEADHLFRDLLIGVTGFFREPEAYHVLEQRVIPQWIEHQDVDTTIRIWIPGCATGEEAYSIAMLAIEKYSAALKPLNLQIFATDINETALNIARQGLYPVSISDDMPPERLVRFFNQAGSHYQISKQVRDLVVFAPQNLISDAPFSRLDLISCRNLLIYLEPEVQRKVISLFHFALNEDGFLFLGSSETIGRHLDMFETVSKKWRLFRRIGPTRRDMVDFPITSGYKRRGMSPTIVQSVIKPDLNFAELTRRQLLNDFAPASVLINRKYQVLYFQGPTGDFLEAPTGEPTRDLIAMARTGLQTKLRAACHKAIHEDQTVRDSSPRVKRDGSWHPCTITVKPLVEPKQAEGLLLVTFQQQETSTRVPDSASKETASPEESSLVRQLEYELRATRDDLQTTIEDKESSNEELKASNEEIMSMNEELQSANEELETSKEELQSLNEELSTVNSQLQDKVEELDKSYNDMTNLLNSADIATLFLDTELGLRQFTPTTGKLLGLIPSDSGRPISTFATDFTSKDLLTDARQVLNTLAPLENTFTTGDGRHFLRRILPYRTSDNRIEGLVVTFIDLTQRIQSEQQARRMATVLRDSNDAITVLTLDGDITAWNRGAKQLYGYTESEALQMNIRDLAPDDRQAETRKLLQRLLQGEQIDSFDTQRQTKDGRRLDVWATVTPLYDESGQPTAVATTERDMSERTALEALQAQSEQLLHLVEHLPAGAVYRRNDALMLNHAAEEITGFRHDELATIDAWFEKLYGKSSAEIRKKYQQDRDKGYLNRSEPIRLRRKDGELRFVEFAVYRDNAQEIWIMHDVTQREEHEKALHDREDRLRTIMDFAADAIIVIDTFGLMTDFNKAAQQLFGYTAEETVGFNVSMLMPSPYREMHDDYLARYRETGKTHILCQVRELPAQRKDGSIFPMQLTVAEIDHLDIFVGIIRDLSKQKTLERQVAEISTLEQERIGQEIHDGLGQQLTGLSLLASSVRQHLASQNHPEEKELDEIVSQLQQAIKSARDLSRGLVPVPVTPEGLTDAFTRLVREVKNSTGIDCSFETHDAVDIKDRTNAMQLYRIAQEAVNNAVKHAHPSQVKITLDGRGDQCEMNIYDNGRGFQTDSAKTKGLGINLMRYRAGIIGCNLEIESTTKGTQVRCLRNLANTAL